ncbi:MAG: hypothetical protein M0017_08645 [Desulfobacteraceae bacterium]|nr:hypothetical protein [Desulfobacteraceae bacterium]
MLLGELAVECGYLTRLQNVQIVLAQRRGGGSYGRIATERGLLTPDQVEELAALQQETTMPLGKILVAETGMTRFQLIMALKEYVREHRGRAGTGNQAREI